MLWGAISITIMNRPIKKKEAPPRARSRRQNRLASHTGRPALYSAFTMAQGMLMIAVNSRQEMLPVQALDTAPSRQAKRHRTLPDSRRRQPRSSARQSRLAPLLAAAFFSPSQTARKNRRMILLSVIDMGEITPWNQSWSAFS